MDKLVFPLDMDNVNSDNTDDDDDDGEDNNIINLP